MKCRFLSALRDHRSAVVKKKTRAALLGMTVFGCGGRRRCEGGARLHGENVDKAVQIDRAGTACRAPTDYPALG